MRRLPAHWIFMALFTVALASESRPPRHLHQLRGVISDKLYGRREPNCTQAQPSPSISFFSIPEYPDVVFEVMPEGPTITLPPDCETPPKPSIDPCLDISTSVPVHNPALAVKNLFINGYLGAKHAELEKLGRSAPPKVPCIPIVQEIPVKPCLPPRPISLPHPKPIDVVVKPPKVPVIPTQYSYKQVNQDGSLTTYTSYLDLKDGVKVTEKGKTLPFFMNRIQNVPVHLPVPILPEVSNIVIPKPVEVNFVHPAGVNPSTSYSYKQIHHDGRLTTYNNGLPPTNNKYGGPVIVTETEKMPPPPVYLLDRIEKAATIAAFPKTPYLDVLAPKPITVGIPAGHVVHNERPSAVPAPGGYSYTQIHSDDGRATISSAPGDFRNLTRSPNHTGFSYNQLNADGKTTTYGRSGVQEHKGVNLAAPGSHVLGVQHVPESYKMLPASNSFSYKQVGNDKVTTYTGTGTFEENFRGNPAVALEGVNHPSRSEHVTDGFEKIAANAIYNRPSFTTKPLVDPFAAPVPSTFVQLPLVHTSAPQRPVKIPSANYTSPFVYKYVHNDGSVTSYNGDGSLSESGVNPVPMPVATIPQNYNRLVESPVNLGLFPVEHNPNAVKPSTPVGSYSYKLVNNHADGKINEFHRNNDLSLTNRPFPASLVEPSSGQRYFDSKIETSFVESSPVSHPEPVPQSYSYKQITNNRFGSYSEDKTEDLIMEEKQAPQQHPSMVSNANTDQDLNSYLYVPPPMGIAPAPQLKKDTTPQSSFYYKHTTENGLYEYSNKLNPADVTTTEPPTKLRRKPAPNVYIDDIPQISSTQKPIVSDDNSLANNPIVVGERSSFSFKSSNADGSTITVKDDGNNAVSVVLEGAAKTESLQEPKYEVTQENDTQRPYSRRNKVTMPAFEVTSPVTEQVKETPRPVSAPTKRLKRKKVVKRVKHRGDIPEDD